MAIWGIQTALPKELAAENHESPINGSVHIAFEVQQKAQMCPNNGREGQTQREVGVSLKGGGVLSPQPGPRGVGGGDLGPPSTGAEMLSEALHEALATENVSLRTKGAAGSR